MGAGIKRATFFFQSDTGYGWTETLFHNAGTDGQVLEAALRLLPTRTRILGTAMNLTYIRASEEGVRGDSAVYAVPPRSARGTSSDGGGDIPNTCLVLRMEGTGSPKARRVLFMRGQPDAEVTLGGQYTPTGAFISGFDAWVKALGTEGFGLRLSTFTDPGSPITAITQAGDGVISVTCAGGLPALVYPGTVNLVGLRHMPGVRGRHSLLKTPAGNIVQFTSSRILPPYNGGGFVQAATPSFVAMNTCQVIRASHRITGRPFDAPRGRRSVR